MILVESRVLILLQWNMAQYKVTLKNFIKTEITELPPIRLNLVTVDRKLSKQWRKSPQMTFFVFWSLYFLLSLYTIYFQGVSLPKKSTTLNNCNWLSHTSNIFKVGLRRSLLGLRLTWEVHTNLPVNRHHFNNCSYISLQIDRLLLGSQVRIHTQAWIFLVGRTTL